MEIQVLFRCWFNVIVKLPVPLEPDCTLQHHILHVVYIHHIHVRKPDSLEGYIQNFANCHVHSLRAILNNSNLNTFKQTTHKERKHA